MNPSQSLPQDQSQIIIEEPAQPPSISKKTGTILSLLGFIGTLSLVVFCMVMRGSPYLPAIAVCALLSWIIMKFGKTIVKKHDIAAYEMERYQDSLNGE